MGNIVNIPENLLAVYEPVKVGRWALQRRSGWRWGVGQEQERGRRGCQEVLALLAGSARPAMSQPRAGV